MNYEEKIDSKLENHELRIQSLEKSDVKMNEQINNLIKELSSLTSWVKALVVSIFGTLVGFIIWYIQSLPK
jgi:predicted nuclease with TOPRIM domain